jgi:hypothetical protein
VFFAQIANGSADRYLRLMDIPEGSKLVLNGLGLSQLR